MRNPGWTAADPVINGSTTKANAIARSVTVVQLVCPLVVAIKPFIQFTDGRFSVSSLIIRENSNYP